MNLAKHLEHLYALLAVLLGLLLKEQGSKTQPEALNLLNLNIEITRWPRNRAPPFTFVESSSSSGAPRKSR